MPSGHGGPQSFATASALIFSEVERYSDSLHGILSLQLSESDKVGGKKEPKIWNEFATYNSQLALGQSIGVSRKTVRLRLVQQV